MLGAGSRVAHYEIEGRLGRGGMGEVYAAFDERLERRVALKFLPAERVLDQVAQGRMLREARAASALKHPGIVTIYEIGEAQGRTYIAMELVEGETLAQLSGRRGPLAPAEAVELVRQIGEALTAAHEAGILHRDIKTANLMVDGRGRVKVLDFGLSKRVDASEPSSPPPRSVGLSPSSPEDGRRTIDPSAPTEVPDSQPSPTPNARPFRSTEPVTIHGERMGTPGSAALELMRGEEADRRSDVFSLGVVLYELLCGRRPFRGRDLAELVDNLAAQRHEPASELNRAVTGELDAVLARALRPDREDRFATVGELVAAAEAAIGGPVARTKRGRDLATVGAAVATIGAALALGAPAVFWAVSAKGSSSSAATPAMGAPKAAVVLPSGAAAPSEPRALTRLGGCAYAPTFADDRTIVFDLTDLAGENHLWSIPLAGGAPRQLTRGPLTEWRAMPGRRPGEVVYLVSNRASNSAEGAGIAIFDLANGKSEMLTTQVGSSAAYVGQDLYYLSRDGSALRRIRAGVDEIAGNWPDEVTAKIMGISRDGKRIALMAVNPGAPRICMLDLPTNRVDCLKSARMTNGRPAFSHDDASVYYAGLRGIGRLRADGSADELVAPGLDATGGLTVSPDGRHIVYSDCSARSAILDAVPGEPGRPLTETGMVSEPGAGPGGVVAYTSWSPDGPALMLREPDGTARQLVHRTGRISQPRFSRDGAHIAFVVAGEGVWMATISRSHTLMPTPITHGAADGDPAWLPDGRLLFTRREGEPVGAFIVDPAGGDPRPLAKVPRRVVGVLPSGRPLLLSIDATLFVEWDFRTRRERPSSVSLEKLGRVVGVAMSWDGRWLAVQAGDSAHRVYRLDLSARKPEPELAFEARPGQTMGTIAITEQGHVIVTPQSWSGELHAIEAPAGTLF